MRLSIIGITANPEEKQYPYREALASYCDLADEVILIDGSKEPITYENNKVQIYHLVDPEVWSWAQHAHRLNYALEKATGDWIIKVDLDWIFHENTFEEIRNRLKDMKNPVATFQKFSVYPRRCYMQKGELPIAINGIFRDKIKYGRDFDRYTDLTFPLWFIGNDKDGLPTGSIITEKEWGRTGVGFWNFDYTFKTLENAKKSFHRMSMSHKQYFGNTKWGNTEDESWDVFLQHMKGRVNRSTLKIDELSLLPKYIRERYEQISPDQFGFNGWNII